MSGRRVATTPQGACCAKTSKLLVLSCSHWLLLTTTDMRRPGSQAAAALFKQDDVVQWRRTLAAYTSCLKGKQGTAPSQRHLVSDDAFLRGEVVRNMRERGQLSHAELSRVMRWKLARGKMRPLQKAVERNPPAAVEAASRKALAALDKGHWRSALKALTKLHAVGPATASIVLCLHAPEQAPFMADEAMEAVPGAAPCSGNSAAYSEEAYASFRDDMIQRAGELEALGWVGCTSEDVGRALWCAAMLSIGVGKKVSKNYELPQLRVKNHTGLGGIQCGDAPTGEGDKPSVAKRVIKDGGAQAQISTGGSKRRRKTLVG
jgi:hypothetical protein